MKEESARWPISRAGLEVEVAAAAARPAAMARRARLGRAPGREPRALRRRGGPIREGHLAARVRAFGVRAQGAAPPRPRHHRKAREHRDETVRTNQRVSGGIEEKPGRHAIERRRVDGVEVMLQQWRR